MSGTYPGSGYPGFYHALLAAGAISLAPTSLYFRDEDAVSSQFASEGHTAAAQLSEAFVTGEFEDEGIQ